VLQSSSSVLQRAKERRQAHAQAQAQGTGLAGAGQRAHERWEAQTGAEPAGTSVFQRTREGKQVEQVQVQAMAGLDQTADDLDRKLARAEGERDALEVRGRARPPPPTPTPERVSKRERGKEVCVCD
jgi:hypothetical protein